MNPLFVNYWTIFFLHNYWKKRSVSFPKGSQITFTAWICLLSSSQRAYAVLHITALHSNGLCDWFIFTFPAPAKTEISYRICSVDSCGRNIFLSHIYLLPTTVLFFFFLNPCLLFIYFSLSMSLPLTFSFSFCLPPSILLIPFLTSSLHHLLNCFCHFFLLLLTLLTISRCWYLIIFPAPPK